MLTRLTLLLLLTASLAPAQESRRIPLAEFRDKMKAAWLGQMAGVGWGAPTEFKSKGAIYPEDKCPKWTPQMINQYNQDDLYVEMTFLRTLELHGFNCSIEQAGIDFANSGYPLWHANKAGRDNLRKGIAPPDSGHPAFNKHADDIDYQIEADFAGIIAPGLPNTAVQLGEKFGRLMNYGDGLYGGQFTSSMYTIAYFESDPVKIVTQSLESIPAQSQYAQCIRDLLAWYKQYPDDWPKCWDELNKKYHLNKDYRKASCDKGAFNIDAKLNGAYIVIGLLYGKHDPDQTMLIAMRCGQDSDCNPSSAAGVLFTTLGAAKLPEKFTSALDNTKTFSHTPYTFPKLLEVSEKLARDAVLAAGGKIDKDPAGQEFFIIPIQSPKPTALEQCWEPAPPRNVKFNPDQMKQIQPPAEPKKKG